MKIIGIDPGLSGAIAILEKALHFSKTKYENQR